LDVLNGTAEFVEEYAKELQASIPSNDPQLQKIFRECTSIHSDLLQLLALVENDGGNDANATRFSIGSLNEEVIDLRSRLMGLQMNLSYIHNKRMAKDTEAIKEAVTELMNGAANSDDASSIRTFYTASSIPYVERQMWRELEKALRERFTTNFVRDNYALIVATVEETVWETTMPPLSDTTTSAPTVTTTSASTDTTMPTSSESNQLSTLVEHTDETAKGTTLGAALGATLSPVKKANQADWSDKTGRTWASHIDENGCECLLTFGS
jgi:hypothetical protein